MILENCIIDKYNVEDFKYFISQHEFGKPFNLDRLSKKGYKWAYANRFDNIYMIYFVNEKEELGCVWSYDNDMEMPIIARRHRYNDVVQAIYEMDEYYEMSLIDYLPQDVVLKNIPNELFEPVCTSGKQHYFLDTNKPIRSSNGQREYITSPIISYFISQPDLPYFKQWSDIVNDIPSYRFFINGTLKNSLNNLGVVKGRYITICENFCKDIELNLTNVNTKIKKYDVAYYCFKDNFYQIKFKDDTIVSLQKLPNDEYNFCSNGINTFYATKINSNKKVNDFINSTIFIDKIKEM